MAEYNPLAPTSLSVAEAKQQLYSPQPTLSVGEAKAALLHGGSNTSLSVSDAKKALLQGPDDLTMGIAEAKRRLLEGTVARKQLDLTEKPAEPEAPESVVQPQPQSQPQAEQLGYDTLLDDYQARQTGGSIANLGLALTGGAARVIGEAVAFVPSLGNYIDSIGISPEEFEMAESIKQKQAIGQTLSPQEQTYFDNEKDGRLETIADIHKKQEFINAIQYGIRSVENWQNKTQQKVAGAQVSKAAEKAVDEFGEGNYAQGLGTITASAWELATQDTQAALEFTAASIPQMLALAYKAVPSVVSLATAQTNAAIEDFRVEYGRWPDEAEKAIAASLSFVSAGLDTFGAKFIFQGKELIKGIKSLTGVTGIKVPSNLFTKVAKVASVPFIEGGTEGAQNVLTQLASKQDLSKVSGKDVVTDTIIGMTSGGHLAAPGAATSALHGAGGAAEKLRKTLNAGADKVIEKGAKAGIGETAAVVQQAKESNTPEVGITAILEADLDQVDKPTQEAYAKDLDELVTNYATKEATDPDNFSEAQLEQYTEQLYAFEDRVYGVEQDLDDVVATLSDTQADSAVTKKAVSDIIDTIQTTSSLTPATTRKILGSDSTFRDNATPEQVQLVEDYQKYQTKTNKIKASADVSNDILTGTGKFKGIESHITNAKRAARKGDAKTITDIVGKLDKFISSQKAKLKTDITPSLARVVKSEIEALEAARVHINNMKSGIAVEAQPEAKPEVAAETKAKTKAKTETKTETTNKVPKGIKVQRQDGDKEVTIEASQELKVLDRKLNILEQIWKTCK